LIWLKTYFFTFGKIIYCLNKSINSCNQFSLFASVNAPKLTPNSQAELTDPEGRYLYYIGELEIEFSSLQNTKMIALN